MIYSNVAKVKNTGSGWHCNCWGATQYVLGAKEKFSWVCASDMDKWLESTTKPVDKPGKHTILVLRDSYGILQHTAVHLFNDIWYEKRGANKSFLSTEQEVYDCYVEFTEDGVLFAEYREVIDE